MQKNFLKTLPLAFLATSMVVSGLTACSSSDDSIAEEPTPVVNPTQTVYRFSIPATIGGENATRAVDFNADGSTLTTTFKTTDKIYVYNVTQEMWYTENNKAKALTPTTEAREATIEGTIDQTLAVGDVLRLFYNLSDWNKDDIDHNGFVYADQTGSAESASSLDFAEATMKVKSIKDGVVTLCQVNDESKLTAEFNNLQSMFRQSLTFKNANGETVTPTITNLTVSLNHSHLCQDYRPLRSGNYVNNFDDLAISNPVITNGNIYLALRFVDSDAADALTFTAQDSEKNIYECTKNAPSGGFKNGKYYHGAMTMTYAGKYGVPKVSGSNAQPNSYNGYRLYEASNVTISGTSIGYYFNCKGGTIILDNLTATYNDQYTPFIYSSKDLTVNVTGENNITCRSNQCIHVDETLKLTGNGTLTVTAGNSQRCGIEGDVNYSNNGTSPNNLYKTTDELDVTSQLALDPAKTTVIRSARTNNSDGTYTWTYTVTTAE